MLCVILATHFQASTHPHPQLLQGASRNEGQRTRRRAHDGTHSTFLSRGEVLGVRHFGPLSVARLCKTEEKVTCPVFHSILISRREDDPVQAWQGKRASHLFTGQMNCWIIADWVLEGTSEGSITISNVHTLWPSSLTPRNLSHGNTCTVPSVTTCHWK